MLKKKVRHTRAEEVLHLAESDELSHLVFFDGNPFSSCCDAQLSGLHAREIIRKSCGPQKPDLYMAAV